MYRFIHIIFISDAPTATWVIFQRVLPIAQVQVSSARIPLNIIFVSNNIHVYTFPSLHFIIPFQANAFASLGHNSFREIAGEPGPCEVQHLIHDHIGTAWGPMQG